MPLLLIPTQSLDKVVIFWETEITKSNCVISTNTTHKIDRISKSLRLYLFIFNIVYSFQFLNYTKYFYLLATWLLLVKQQNLSIFRNFILIIGTPWNRTLSWIEHHLSTGNWFSKLEIGCNVAKNCIILCQNQTTEWNKTGSY